MYIQIHLLWRLFQHHINQDKFIKCGSESTKDRKFSSKNKFEGKSATYKDRKKVGPIIQCNIILSPSYVSSWITPHKPQQQHAKLAYYVWCIYVNAYKSQITIWSIGASPYEQRMTNLWASLNSRYARWRGCPQGLSLYNSSPAITDKDTKL